MGINLATEVSFSNTGCCLEIHEYIQTSGCFLGRVEEKGVSKQEYDGCKRLSQE